MRNYEIYDTLEYKSWASRFGLISAEKYLFEKYLFASKRHVKSLDIGTGNGRFLFALAQKGFTDLHGIDLSENLLSQAKDEAAKNYHFIKFYKMSAASL